MEWSSRYFQPSSSNRKLYSKIHYLTREFRVKLHAKTDIARIAKRFSKFKFHQESGRRRTTGIDREIALIHYVNGISQNKLHVQTRVILFACCIICGMSPVGPLLLCFHSFHRIWKKKFCRFMHNSELFLKGFNKRDLLSLKYHNDNVYLTTMNTL